MGASGVAHPRSTPTEPPDLFWMDGRSHPKRLTELSPGVLANSNCARRRSGT